MRRVLRPAFYATFVNEPLPETMRVDVGDGEDATPIEVTEADSGPKGQPEDGEAVAPDEDKV